MQEDPILLINTPVTLALAIVALWLGYHINRRIRFLHEYNVPPAVSGGLLISTMVAATELVTRWEIRFDLQLRDLLLIAFFSTIGLSAKLRQMLEGGRILAIMLGLAVLFLLAPALITVPEFSDRRLAWIGLWAESPPTTDVVPFFPWFGVILLGIAGMRMLLDSPWQPALAAWRPGRGSNWLATAGRWSLVIYLLHQPLLFGGLSLLAQLQQPALMPPVASTDEAFVASCESECARNGSGAPYCQRYCSCALEVVERENLWALLNSSATTPEGQAALGSVQRLCEAMAE